MHPAVGWVQAKSQELIAKSSLAIPETALRP
jgi:hypothetical protein